MPVILVQQQNRAEIKYLNKKFQKASLELIFLLKTFKKRFYNC